MPQQNLVSFSIPDKDLEEVKSAIAILNSKLGPHLKTLSATERVELPKMETRQSPLFKKRANTVNRTLISFPRFLTSMNLKTISMRLNRFVHSMLRCLRWSIP